MSKLYPMIVSVEIAITDGTSRGTVTHSLPPERLPNEDDLDEAIKGALAAIPDDYRLMTRHEHFMHMVIDRFGRIPRLALPNIKDGDEWHNPEAATDYCDWGVVDDDEEYDD